MWPLCPSANILWLLLPLLLGVLTGYWAWRGRGSIFTPARVPTRRAPVSTEREGPRPASGSSSAVEVPVVGTPPDVSLDLAVATFAEPANELAPADVPPMKEPEPEPASAPVVPAEIPTDLTMIRGIGPALASTLHSLGVTRLDQIAIWSPEESARVDQKLGSFAGRMRREKWIEQARLLTKGDHAAFVTRFGGR